jgi:hypothetical protein
MRYITTLTKDELETIKYALTEQAKKEQQISLVNKLGKLADDLTRDLEPEPEATNPDAGR